jgi:hypothetical protein
MKKPKVISNVHVDNIHIDLYHTWLNIYIGDSVYNCIYFADKSIDMIECDWVNTDAVFWVHQKNNIWFMVFNKNKINHGTIAHECFHATARILQRKGIMYSEETEEAYAYLLDFLVTKTIEILKEHILN